MKEHLYPIKFEPILKEKIWGGKKLNTILNKQSNHSNIGESWEISDVKGNTSIVVNGNLKGKSLKQLIELFGPAVIGHKNHKYFGNKFPLLVKFIDAREDLSIQLHPNDDLALKRHNSFGKTEMWYVMQADDDANLIIGFNRKITPDTYLTHLEEKTLPKILNFEKVKSGDSFFIEAGRVHTIGAGVLLAEIQQTSNITYRIYDWDRIDSRGKSRELHNDLALDAIDFNMEDDFKVSYSKVENRSNQMVKCPYFTTNYLSIGQTLKKQNFHDSFIIYICVEGNAKFVTETSAESIAKGETILIPASIKSFEIVSKKAKLLEVYV